MSNNSKVLSMTIEQARRNVSEMYPGRWKPRVADMPDDQVLAIALRDQDECDYYLAELRHYKNQRRQNEAYSECG